MEHKASPPAIIRRQSLPEELLSLTQNRTFLPSSLQTDFNSTDSTGAPVMRVSAAGEISFKHSDNNRFARPSKRKSQSLYEACGQDLKNLAFPKEDNQFSSESYPILQRVHSSPPSSAAFTHINLAKPEKQPEDIEYDFLLQQQQHQPVMNSPPANPLHSKENHVNIIERIKIPGNGYEPQMHVHGVFEPFPGQKIEHHSDEFQHNIHQNIVHPPSNQPMHYPGEGFAFNTMNGFHFQGVPPFHINPLNNFSPGAPPGIPGYPHMPMTSPADVLPLNQPKSEAKRRRSRVPSSQYRGVSKCGKDNKFQARIRVQGKVKYLGRFKNEIEAAKCYDKHAIEYLGVNAQTNFPLPGSATSSN